MNRGSSEKGSQSLEASWPSWMSSKTAEEKEAEKRATREAKRQARIKKDKEREKNEQEQTAAKNRGCKKRSWLTGCSSERPNVEKLGSKTFCCPKTT